MNNACGLVLRILSGCVAPSPNLALWARLARHCVSRRYRPSTVVFVRLSNCRSRLVKLNSRLMATASIADFRSRPRMTPSCSSSPLVANLSGRHSNLLGLVNSRSQSHIVSSVIRQLGSTSLDTALTSVPLLASGVALTTCWSLLAGCCCVSTVCESRLSANRRLCLQPRIISSGVVVESSSFWCYRRPSPSILSVVPRVPASFVVGSPPQLVSVCCRCCYHPVHWCRRVVVFVVLVILAWCCSILPSRCCQLVPILGHSSEFLVNRPQSPMLHSLHPREWLRPDAPNSLNPRPPMNWRVCW